MLVAHGGNYTHLNEPFVHLELLGRSDVLSEETALLVDSGFNGLLMISRSKAAALGWHIPEQKVNIRFGDGTEVEAVKTFGYIRFIGKLLQIEVIVVLEKLIFSSDVSIEGYIGIGLLKGSRIDFGQDEFHISAYEG